MFFDRQESTCCVLFRNKDDAKIMVSAYTMNRTLIDSFFSGLRAVLFLTLYALFGIDDDADVS